MMAENQNDREDTGDVVTLDDVVTLKEYKEQPDTRVTLREAVVRMSIGLLLIVLLFVILVIGLTKTGSESWSSVKEYLEIVVPVLTTLLGSVIGFYFGRSRD